MAKLPPNRIRWAELLEDLTDSDRGRSIVIERTTETERMAVFLLRRESWAVKAIAGAQKDFNLELFKFDQHVAAKVLNQRDKVTLAQIEKFIDFLTSGGGIGFTGGICISTSGFTRSVYSYLRDENITNLKLAILDGSCLHWNCEEIDREHEQNRTTYIGVFTCKGGVGKTTIAAHLAGAFALNGYDVSLVDLDHQQNMRKLLGSGVYLPASNRRRGARIDVLDPDGWNSRAEKRTKFVICDCNPEFESNPPEFLRRFDYCIVPTSLSPLGINKNADVIKRTFDLIRKKNSRAKMYVLINSFQADEPKRNTLLNAVLKSQFKQMSENDPHCHYIDPEEVAIRFSKQLLYWGFHLFDGNLPTLAFRTYGKYSFPRMDFLKLVDYLEQRTDISNSNARVMLR